jgi:Family of unknown function (DUF6049)
MAAAGEAVPRPAAGPAAPVTLTLASQTPWVQAGQEFQLSIGLTPPDTTVGTIVVSVFSAIPNRIDFNRTLAGKLDESLLTRPLTVPLSALPPDAAGRRTIVIPTQGPTQPRDRTRLLLSRSGVYPVRVEYRPGDGTPVVTMVTHLIYVAGSIVGPKLDVTWIVPIHVPPQPGPDGTDTFEHDQSARLADLVTALATHPATPVVVQPTPDTVAALAASPNPADSATLATLVKLPKGRQLVSGPYVSLSLPGLLAAGLADDATLQVTRGGDELGAALHIRPDGRTWVVNGPLDEASATFLRAAQVDRLVIPEDDLSPNPLRVTIAHPFEVVASPTSRVLAATADPGLAAHFSDTTDPVLAAHQLLADLAVLYLDLPGQTRGVVVATPQSWQPDASFLRTFLDGMAGSPVLSAVTLDTLFTTVPPATVSRDQPLVRTLVGDRQVSSDAATFPGDNIRNEQRRLEAFASALPGDNPLTERLTARLQRILLTAESADLSSLRARQGEIDRVEQQIDAQLALIHLPSARHVTLTARTGKLPITIQSAVDYPMRVILRVDSDKLSFPGSGTAGEASRTIPLHKGNNPEDFSVRARTAGSFPLHISLLSPDGRLVLSKTTFTIRSTALSGVGLILSVGAGLFLLVWWGRQAWTGRRSRRMSNAAVSPAPSGALAAR